MAVVRTVNTASLTDTPIEIVGRMREGMSFLELWADTEWSVFILHHIPSSKGNCVYYRNKGVILTIQIIGGTVGGKVI